MRVFEYFHTHPDFLRLLKTNVKVRSRTNQMVAVLLSDGKPLG